MTECFLTGVQFSACMDCTVESFIPPKKKERSNKRKERVCELPLPDDEHNVSLSNFVYKPNKYPKINALDENINDATIACLLQCEELKQIENIPGSEMFANSVGSSFICPICKMDLAALPVAVKEQHITECHGNGQTKKKKASKTKAIKSTKPITRQKIAKEISFCLQRNHCEVFREAMKHMRQNCEFAVAMKTKTSFIVDYSRKKPLRILEGKQLLWEICGSSNSAKSTVNTSSQNVPTEVGLCKCSVCLESQNAISDDLLKLLNPAYSELQDGVILTSGISVPIASVIYKLRVSNPIYCFKETEPKIIRSFVLFLYSGVLPAKMKPLELEKLGEVASQTGCRSLLNLIHQHDRSISDSVTKPDYPEFFECKERDGQELVDSLWVKDASASQSVALFESQFVLLSPASESQVSSDDNEVGFNKEEEEFLDFLDRTQTNKSIFELSGASMDPKIARSESFVQTDVDKNPIQTSESEDIEIQDELQFLERSIIVRDGVISEKHIDPNSKIVEVPKDFVGETDSDEDIIEIPLSQRIKLSTATQPAVKLSSSEFSHSEVGTEILSESRNADPVKPKRVKKKNAQLEDLAKFVWNRKDIWVKVLQYMPLNLLSFMNNFEEQNPEFKVLEKDVKIFFDHYGIICSEKTISTV